MRRRGRERLNEEVKGWWGDIGDFRLGVGGIVVGRRQSHHKYLGLGEDCTVTAAWSGVVSIDVCCCPSLVSKGLT